MTTERPLFIPLKTAYFVAFMMGQKTEEYRPYGPRWNERTCQIGREVVLSLGYGTRARLVGRVTGFSKAPSSLHVTGWHECYGDRGGPVAVIRIELSKAPAGGLQAWRPPAVS